MAEFEPAFEHMIRNEGGYKLTDIAGDRGGMTYAGIARTRNPDWAGWPLIDRGATTDPQLTTLVREFYRARFWNPVSGDAIVAQAVAEAIFDFGVNAGPRVAVKLAQTVVGATPDGALGPKTLAAINATEARDFVFRYAIAKLARYAEICNRDRSQSKFLLGWINRTLKGLA